MSEAPEIKLAHVGINGTDEADALSIAAALGALLKIEPGKNGNSSVFVGKAAEIMKGGGRGQHGHLGFGTPDVDAAVAWYEAQGIEFDESSAKRDDAGHLKAIYFKEEIAGFAIHLMKA